MVAKLKKKKWTQWRIYRVSRASGMSCPLYMEIEIKNAKVWKECLINFRF